jgi:ATP-dependent Clp protease adaptor protein ClpS
MSDIRTKTRTKVRLKTEKPRLHKVILLNDDYTPREFVVTVLKAVFRMTEEQAYRVMVTAHKRGACVVAVFANFVSVESTLTVPLGAGEYSAQARAGPWTNRNRRTGNRCRKSACWRRGRSSR